MSSRHPQAPRATAGEFQATAGGDTKTVSPKGSALEAHSVWKRFGQTIAVRDVSMSVPCGVIRGLVGENGAGKSTFLGVAAGRLRPSSGTVRVAGTTLKHASPRAARSQGLAAIYQELALVPAADGVANVFLGHELTRLGTVHRAAMEEQFDVLCQRLQVRINPRKPVRDLSIGDQQMIEIMRGLNAQASVILLDEPTSALQRDERERLFVALRDLRGTGVTSVFVSHDLDDVLELADEVTVFRNGEVADTKPSADWTKPSIVRAMLGPGAAYAIAQPTQKRPHVADPVLKVHSLCTPSKLQNLSLEVRPGEILGLGGLAGSGRSSLLRELGGVHSKGATGSISTPSGLANLPRSPSAAINRGIGLISEDRRKSGLALGMTALENILLPGLRGFGVILRGREAHKAQAAARRAGFDPARLHTPARELSGGNQQKLLLARWISAGLTVLLADEPTRGVDVAAKAEILDTIRDLASDGMAVIIASSDLTDLEAIADRVLVLSNGRQLTELDKSRGDQITPATILHAATQAISPLELH